MSAGSLLAELDAAGVHVARDGDALRVRGELGVALAPYLDRICAHKPTLLRELLQREIVEAVTVHHRSFDRAAYDRLWVLWDAVSAERETTQ